MLRRLIWVFALLPCLPAAVGAGEAARLAAEAEAKAQAGHHVEAIDAMREGLLAVWSAAPLSFKRSLFVTEKPAGYGLFEPRPDNVFKSGEILIVYVEPVGFGWRKQGNLYHSLLVVGCEIRDADGRVLVDEQEFARFAFASHAQNTEYMSHITLDISGAPAGRYVLGVTYTDEVKGQSASFDLPFEIR